jgi:hypothetical protein
VSAIDSFACVNVSFVLLVGQSRDGANNVRCSLPQLRLPKAPHAHTQASSSGGHSITSAPDRDWCLGSRKHPSCRRHEILISSRCERVTARMLLNPKCRLNRAWWR